MQPNHVDCSYQFVLREVICNQRKAKSLQFVLISTKMWITFTNQTIVDLISKIDRNIDIFLTKKNLWLQYNMKFLSTWFIYLRNYFRIWKIDFFLQIVW